MNRHRFVRRLVVSLGALALIPWIGVTASGQTKPTATQQSVSDRQIVITDAAGRKHTRVKPIKQAEREAAADRLKAKIIKAKKGEVVIDAAAAIGIAAATPSTADGSLLVGLNGELIPDYSGVVPNYANSPAPVIDPVTGAITGGIRKFVDGLPGLGAGKANNLGQYLPIATADTASFPGSDYYEIGLVEYREQMHSDLPPLTGPKMDPATTGGTKLRGYVQELGGLPVTDPHYLGPVIIATKGRPVRIKFTNRLPTGAGGNLFVPNDNTLMGAGPGPLNTNFAATSDVLCKKDPATGLVPQICYSENRATIHLHGGVTPWISDGTPHQWITPAGEPTSYKEGVSAFNVPDMPNPGKAGSPTNPAGSGSQTFYYTNDQSARLMFYHDHASGTTRLNVYIGEAAGYLITDAVEQDLVGRGLIPTEQIPLVIQEKLFIDPNTIGYRDPTWNWGTGAAAPYTDRLGNSTTLRQPVLGDLWWPHVYMPAQNPYDPSGMNAMGRWHYGPWFWPPTAIPYGPMPNPYYDAINAPWQPLEVPSAPNPSWGAEGFLDTPVINGTLYPRLEVEPKAYRFRILNAANDRFWNLQFYEATSIVSGIVLATGGSGYTDPTRDVSPVVTIADCAGCPGKGATALATVDQDPLSVTYGQIIAVDMTTVGSGYVAPTVTIAPPFIAGGVAATATATVYNSAPTEVGMLPAVTTAGFPPTWPADGREGGVPDPALAGPSFVMIGTEGGFLPMPVVVANQPIVWNADPTTFNFGNVSDFGLLLGPAERADVVVDFTAYAGKTLILYNDAPAAFPALDPRNDYYTSNPDRQDTGGAPPTLPGYGPNIRTMMQVYVKPAITTPSVFSLPNLMAFWKPDPLADPLVRPVQGVFQRGQDEIVVGQSAYDEAYGKTFPATYPAWGIVRIADTATTFETVGGAQVTVPLAPKAIHDEMGATFDDYGRMASKLGLELPQSTAFMQNFVMQGYNDPSTELVRLSRIGTPIGDPLSDGTQLWKITHNGVDTHPVHFHLFHVQLVNRVGWDNMVRMPHPTELGWKDTLRISPLEDTIVALRPIAPAPDSLPFEVPNSYRPLNPALPLGSTLGFTHRDPLGNNITVFNDVANFGWEYVWHCHILSHEENDMMRAISFAVPPLPPANLVATVVGNNNQRRVVLTWTASVSATLSGYTIQRATDPNFTMNIVTTNVGLVTTFTDPIRRDFTPYFYRVAAANTVGSTAPGFPTMTALSDFTPSVTVNAVPAPTNLTASLNAVGQVLLTFLDGATNETGFVIERAVDNPDPLLIVFAPIASLPARTGTGAVSYTDGTAVQGLTYHYRVQAVNGAISFGYSNVAVISVAPPLAPADLTYTGTIRNTNASWITLTWTDNSGNESGFIIQRAGDVNFTVGLTQFTVGANVTTYTDTVGRGATFYYRVAATNVLGQSPWSLPITAVAP
ncbi:MAG TPA: hypothetical protein VK886_17790 [Vicinamibacterales bacterium]|nr:hypothetical protein [Vicinamibacterales bacterium]